MKTILYFKNRYIDKLEDLCNLFRGNINEDLKRELIASFQDHTLEKWLEEGNDECKLLFEKLKSVDKKSANQEIVSNLKQIFADENIKAENSSLNFEDYCQIEEVAYEKIDSYGNAISALLKVNQKEAITFKKDEPVSFKVKLKIKVINPDNERLLLHLKIKSMDKILSDIPKSLYLNKRKNDIIEFSFAVNLHFNNTDLFNIVSIEFNDKVLYSFNISNNKFEPVFESQITEKQKNVILQILKDMILVEGGTFTMGATPEQLSNALENEKPAHKVTLSNYSICKTVITQEQWETIMDNGMESPTISAFKRCFINSIENTKYDNYPIEISWDAAQEFIKRINKLSGKRFSLPTEAQWEYAARGGYKSKGYIYSGSNNIDDVAWYKVNSVNRIHPVATKQPNELGIYDMSGNVSEWCLDVYEEYSDLFQNNPKGLSSGLYRVVRGGSFNKNANYCRVSCRNNRMQDYRNDYIGFRLVLAL